MIETQISSNKRLVKNTFLLYIRTFLTMLISLYTSRIILDTLGIEDYGIYNIVGGFVAIFSIVSGTLTATTQRYLTFELGKKENSNSQKIFGISMTIHWGLVCILLILFETVGLWFLNYKLNIEPNRLVAANWVFQCSVFTFLINIVSVPYIATIIAHEKMEAFAYISLLEVGLKLVVVYLLYFSTYDRLIVYVVLLLFMAIIIRVVYTLYCHRFFPETHYKLVCDKTLYKEMFGFAGMNFLGAFASIVADQGVNVLLNLFFGVTVNAARGIAVQVQGAVMKFVNDFMTALNPQITKTFASGNPMGSMRLVYHGAKFSFFLLLLIITPLFFRIDYILSIWLVQYPDYTVSFIRFTMLCALVTVLSNPLITIILATGHLKSNTLWIGGTRLLIFPLCYLVLKCGYSPDSVYFIVLIMEIISLIVRLLIVKNMISIPISGYLRNVIMHIIPIFFIVFCAVYFIERSLPDHFSGFVLYCLISVLLTITVIVNLGLKKNERQQILSFIVKKVLKR